MYTNVSMLVYVIEPKWGKGKLRVYLKEKKKNTQRFAM